MRFIIISGLSGAGKSQAAKFLEDAGYYTVDNMPAVLMPRFAEVCRSGGKRYEKVALVSDIRGGVDFSDFFSALDEMKAMGCDVKLLFLEASTEAIIKRYKETRRAHPLCADGDLSLEEAVDQERELLSHVRERADYIIDSTTFSSTKKLRNTLLEMFGTPVNAGMEVSVLSFGYKYGIPLEADLLIDVRFLPNPFYLPELRKLTGLDKPVTDFLDKYPETGQFLALFRKNLEFLLPLYATEGKSVLIIGVGCTGGQHCSVAMSHAIAGQVAELGYAVREHHRDMTRDRK
ncbi:MAG: RNase adapter RapZ [Clostridiales bacterium]|nr:RNase adapter RapZ [Clostridiales bacterium]